MRPGLSAQTGRRRARSLPALGGAFLLATVGAARADIPLQPFAVDSFARPDSAADARFLNPAPAGAEGFVTVRDGHLAFSDGRRFRCWGVNLAGWTAGSALLPPHADADVYVAQLARLGVNCVRFQFLDLPDSQKTEAGDDRTDYRVPVTYTPSGLIDATRDDTKVFSPEQLDRLDYLVSRLKARGIYTDFNLNVGRRYKAGDGVPDYSLIGVAKGITYFGPELIARQKEYAKALLDHVNAYTRTRYADDPSIAIVELVNENSVLEFWMRNWLRGELTAGAPQHQLDLTPHYKALLVAKYNAWLAANLSPSALANVRREAGVGPDGQVGLTRRGDFAVTPDDRLDAEARFYSSIESGFFRDMESYLHHDLGVKSLIIDTNDHTFQITGLPLLRSTSKGDIVDGHVYWQHPAIYGARNTPMVDDPLHSIVVKLTRSAYEDKPYTVSEVNEPFPSDYDGEFIPILAAYAAFQDWDGVFVYADEPKLKGSWKPYIGDHFDISQDPVKTAEMEAGAMMFLRQDIAPAKQTILRTYSTVDIDNSIRMPASGDPFYMPSYDPTVALEHGSRVACLDCAPAQPIHGTGGDPIMSDTGQLAWFHDKAKGGLVRIASDRSEALVGFVKANGVETPHMAPDIANDFSTLILSSMDGKPIGRADRLLLTAGGKVENAGAMWDARKAMYTAWGGAPTMIEPVTGWVLFKDLEGAVDVTATPLNGAGRPLATLHGRYLERGWEIPVGTPAAVSYLIEVVR